MNKPIIQSITPEVDSHLVVVEGCYLPYRREKFGIWSIAAHGQEAILIELAFELEKAFQSGHIPKTYFETAVSTLRFLSNHKLENVRDLVCHVLDFIDDVPIPLDEGDDEDV